MFGFSMWATKERAEWSPQRQTDYAVAQRALAEAQKNARYANGELVTATQNLSYAKCGSVHVAQVTVQRREDAPNFDSKYDVPYVVEEATDHTGRIYSYDRTTLRELSRKENPHWKAQLAAVRQRIKDAEQVLAEAQEAHDAATAVLRRAEKKLKSFE